MIVAWRTDCELGGPALQHATVVGRGSEILYEMLQIGNLILNQTEQDVSQARQERTLALSSPGQRRRQKPKALVYRNNLPIQYRRHGHDRDREGGRRSPFPERSKSL